MSDHNKFKRIFSFTINKETEVDEPTESQDADGKPITIVRKVKKQIPQKYFIRKPTREIREEAELFYNVVYSEGMKAGLLTKQLLSKRYDNDGGDLSEEQRKEYKKSADRLLELEGDFQKLLAKEEKDRTEEDKKKIEEIKLEILKIQRQIIDLESYRKTLFNCTAESRAENKTKIWYTLYLAYSEAENGDIKGLFDVPNSSFSTDSYKERMKKYDEIEESEDSFMKKVVLRFLFFVSFWFDNNELKEDDFNKLNKILEESEIKQ